LEVFCSNPANPLQDHTSDVLAGQLYSIDLSKAAHDSTKPIANIKAYFCKFILAIYEDKITQERIFSAV